MRLPDSRIPDGRGFSLINVAMGDARCELVLLQRLLQPFRHHHRAVLSAGAAESVRYAAARSVSSFRGKLVVNQFPTTRLTGSYRSMPRLLDGPKRFSRATWDFLFQRHNRDV